MLASPAYGHRVLFLSHLFDSDPAKYILQLVENQFGTEDLRKQIQDLLRNSMISIDKVRQAYALVLIWSYQNYPPEQEAALMAEFDKIKSEPVERTSGQFLIAECLNGLAAIYEVDGGCFRRVLEQMSGKTATGDGMTDLANVMELGQYAVKINKFEGFASAIREETLHLLVNHPRSEAKGDLLFPEEITFDA